MNQASQDFVLPTALIERLQSVRELGDDYLRDETEAVQRMLDELEDYRPRIPLIELDAQRLVLAVRANRDELSPLDAFMLEYDLSSEEGVMLMCIAEALLRIPDDATAEALIEDKLSSADWDRHLGHSESVLVNASTWGLMLTGRLVKVDPASSGGLRDRLKNLVKRSGEPMIKLAMRQAMKIMGQQFVMDEDIQAAIKRAAKPSMYSALCSFDMLGEAAVTEQDAQRYQRRYLRAIETLAQQPAGDLHQRHEISVKLSALHARYEHSHLDRALQELLPRFRQLALAARAAGIGLCMDAEEADRLELSVILFNELARDRDLADWDGLGIAVQSFQKRALPLLKQLMRLAQQTGRVIPVRLVKGAYWDTEIKLAQEQGIESYPVYTRKINTDVAYLACARFLLQHRDCFYPQFASHNAHSIAAVMTLAGDQQGFEFQRLHGMGVSLFRAVATQYGDRVPCRVYAPVGGHQDLLPYLVRRLLENGANSSFVNRIVNRQLPVEEVVRDPVREVDELDSIANPAIELPPRLYGDERLNSKGLNVESFQQQLQLREQLQQAQAEETEVGLLSAVKEESAEAFDIVIPQQPEQVIGHWREPTAGCVQQVIECARSAQASWDRVDVDQRAAALEKTAELLEQKMALFLRLCIEEAGKTIPDAIAEVREAVDFCRYYAIQARRELGGAVDLPGPTGESNRLLTHGRGVFVCVSPWNFPLAIFCGQVSAALVSGNSVIAKPAEQTTLIAWHAVQCLHQAGVPREVLHLVPGRGQTVGAQLSASPRVAGVAFTGSNQTARMINLALAQREGPIASMVAETGGQNAMLVDSSSLPEQVVRDVMQSSFGSAGQRCSALRVLFLQEDTADRIIELLAGAMQELTIGDPRWLATDVGPVIDQQARQQLLDHIEWLSANAKLIARSELPPGIDSEGFVAPHAFELKSMDQLDREHFGPILHVIRYKRSDLDKVIDDVNASGYGLTLGVHSRIEQNWRYIMSRVKVGNCYVNRTTVGAVVGVQPFGGEGLSGTGPKAGGPHYLFRFITERTQTINTAAIGGNTGLLAG